jgi:hypothetical protein
VEQVVHLVSTLRAECLWRFGRDDDNIAIHNMNAMVHTHFCHCDVLAYRRVCGEDIF